MTGIQRVKTYRQASCYSFVVGTWVLLKCFEEDVALLKHTEPLLRNISNHDYKSIWKALFLARALVQILQIPLSTSSPFTPSCTPKNRIPKTTHWPFMAIRASNDALIGRWSSPSAKKAPRGWKKILQRHANPPNGFVITLRIKMKDFACIYMIRNEGIMKFIAVEILQWDCSK